MGQRKVNALAIEYCDDIGITEKPVIVSHHMLMGLQPGEEKMSKSKPDSAIFMEDSGETSSIKRPTAFLVKLRRTQCWTTADTSSSTLQCI
jgi:tyrosyl-tRNA synthetase